MASDSDQIKSFEKDVITFHGHNGKVSFAEFDKYMARYMRMKFGRKIGEGLWMDSLPIIEGTGRLTNPNFEKHCEDVLEAIGVSQPSKVKLHSPADSPFWTREWQTKWRQDEWERMQDVVSIRSKGQVILSIDELGLENARSTRKHLKKQFGGASEDVKFREAFFESGMPEKGKKPFYKGIDIEAKLRQMNKEWTELVQMCPAENRADYKYGKESELVKICIKHLKPTEYDVAVRELLNEIKYDRKLARAISGDDGDDEEFNVEDWEHRNYKDGWLPTFEKLREKLVSYYKELKYNSVTSKDESSEKKIPTMLTKALIQKAVSAMFAPGFGQKPKYQSSSGDGDNKPKGKCWGCGLIGHRKGDPICKAAAGTLHENAPAKAKRKFKAESESKSDGGPSVKKPDGICRFFSRNGTCKFGANCKFKHEEGSKPNKNKKVRFASAQKKKVSALKAKVVKEIKDADQDEIEDILKGFLVVRTIPREPLGRPSEEITAMNSVLIDLALVAFDTGAAQGISTSRDDFTYLDTSEKSRNSVSINGPSVGTPQCEGRGPLVYTFKMGDKLMGLIHPQGIYASSDNGGSQFRLASAMEMKKKGVRYIGGKFNGADFIECVRSGIKLSAQEVDGILAFETVGVASDIEISDEFHQLVRDIECGIKSPMVEITPFLKGVYAEEGESNRRYSKLDSLRFNQSVGDGKQNLEVYLLNEAKLTGDQRARLYCRRFAYCDTNIFKAMHGKEEFGNFPKLPVLNEDNLVADLAKFRRKPYKRNDPANTMNSPPFWRVFCDGYGGQQSLGGESYDGAVGAYLFVCCSTGSTDIRLYASHKQFPIALHQFLVRVQAEYWKCRVIFVDTHSVNISASVEEVLALFQVQLMPISTGTPQEMAFAESRVRVIKRMSTAMLSGAPHLDEKCWALADKYSVYVSDFLPQQSRNNHCSFHMRTGRCVDWELIQLKVFGAPTVYSDPNGPIHKRAPIVEKGYYVGCQWPAVLIKREKDGKIILVSRQKIRVHESMYLHPLATQTTIDAIASVHNGNAIEPIADDDTTIFSMKPATDNNMVQSAKSLQNHKQKLVGTSHGEMSAIEESAMYGNIDQLHEGIYTDSVLVSDADKVILEIEEELSRGSTMKDALLKAIRKTSKVIPKRSLARGKNKKATGDVTSENILESKRKKQKVLQFDRLKNNHGKVTKICDGTSLSIPSSRSGEKFTSSQSGEKFKSSRVRKGKGKMVAKIGDLIYVFPEIFDDKDKSYSKQFPDRVFGTVNSIGANGIANVTWVEDGSRNDCKLRDLYVAKPKRTVRNVIAGIIALLVKGKPIKRKLKDDFPKDFFEVLVREDWRKWVEAVKKELEAWDDNNAVEVVDICSVPVTAKIVPLGELYTLKRDGTYKFRQYLMGNLLRAGVDYDNNFSTTISSTGITVFYSMATTSAKPVGGWDAVAGYLQTKEQFDIYAYLPTHADYSSLEYEDIAILRRSFLKIFKVEGIQGIKKFARNYKKVYRATPSKVYKCNSSIYGNQSAGMEFEKLMNSVHIATAQMTQTQPEPSMYVKIKVDTNDIVVGYLLVIAFVDDVRYFGTEPEVEEYKKAVLSRLKVKFEKPPVQDFVSIETYQNLEEGTFELKMPKYFEKAKTFFKDYIKGEFKERKIPLTVLDEKCLFENATAAEIEEAKGLPFLQAVGILSYPASNCKFEMRYAISVLGSRRAGWSKKHFAIAVKLFEYALTTKEIGLIFSKGLDPHGENKIYAYGDASLRIPRPQGCRIVMMNGAALSFVSKMQTLTAPSTTWAETVTLFDCSTDVLGIRNLLEELGHLQESATIIYQDNKSAIQIANNRGSLGKSSRAMDLKTLAIRNRIEDHNVETEYLSTKGMLADMGSKALPEFPFTPFRDTMNGYALVRARFPEKVMSPYIYEIEDEMIVDLCKTSQHENQLKSTQAMIMTFTYHDDMGSDTEVNSSDTASWESEEEEDEDMMDDLQVGEFFNDLQAQQVDNVDNEDEEISTDYELGDLPHPQMMPVNELDSVLFVPSELANEDDFIRDQELEIVLNDNIFEFNHEWQLHRMYPNIQRDLFELDNLPDPRLYGIDVLQMRSLARRQCLDCRQGFHLDYESYMIHIETSKMKMEMMDHYLIHLDAVVDSHVVNLLQCKLTLPNPVMFFPSILNPINKEQRKQEVNRALNKFVIRLEIHIEALSWYDTLDNVQWGIGTGEPTPKLTWLKYLRWRRYYLHLLLSGIAFTPQDEPFNPEGPPYLRPRDSERMGLTNCFALCKSTGQFASNSLGCHRAADPEDPLPRFPNVCDDDILAYQFKSMWSINLHEYDVEAIWIYKGTTLTLETTPTGKPKLTRRQKRLQNYLVNRYPEWGSMSLNITTKKMEENETWITNDTDESLVDGWDDERPAKQQRYDSDQK